MDDEAARPLADPWGPHDWRERGHRAGRPDALLFAPRNHEREGTMPDQVVDVASLRLDGSPDQLVIVSTRRLIGAWHLPRGGGECVGVWQERGGTPAAGYSAPGDDICRIAIWADGTGDATVQLVLPGDPPGATRELPLGVLLDLVARYIDAPRDPKGRPCASCSAT